MTMNTIFNILAWTLLIGANVVAAVTVIKDGGVKALIRLAKQNDGEEADV